MKKIDKEELQKYLENHSMFEAALHFDCSLSTIYNHAYQLGIRNLNRPYAKLEKIQEKDFISYFQDHTVTETASHFNISIASCEILARKFNCKKHSPAKYKTLDIEEVKAYLKENGKAKTCEYFGIYNSDLQKIIKANDITEIKKRGDLYEAQEFIDFCKTHTSKEIAEEFGLRDYVVRTACNRRKIEYVHLNRNKSPRPKAGRNEMIKFLAPHFNFNDIANVFDITTSRVQQIVSDFKPRK